MFTQQYQEATRPRLPAARVRRRALLQDAAGAAKSIFSHAPRPRAADQFRRLAAEVLERLRPTRWDAQTVPGIRAPVI